MKKLLALALIGFVAACSGPKRVSVAEMGGGGASSTESTPTPRPEPKDVKAHAAEARDCLGSIKDRARVMYAKTEKAVLSIKDLGINEAELNGKYVDYEDFSVSGTVEAYVVTCRDVFNDEPRDYIVTCNLKTGDHKFNR